jgi:hypothetical protein
MPDQEDDAAALSRRLEAAASTLMQALRAPPEREAELLALLRQAADSYWRRRRLPPAPAGWHPSVTTRRLAALQRSTRKAADIARKLPIHDRALVEALVGPGWPAQLLELAEALEAGLHDVETVLEFAVPERSDKHLALLVDHLASVFTMITGSRPTRTWNPDEEDFTSSFFRFARAAVAAIDPQAEQHGSIDEATKRTCAKHPEGAPVARRAKRPS